MSMATIKLIAPYLVFMVAGCGMALLMLSVMFAVDRISLVGKTAIVLLLIGAFRIVVALLLLAIFIPTFLFWLLVDKESVLLPGLFVSSFVGTSALLRFCYLRATPDLLAKIKKVPPTSGAQRS